MRRLFNGLCTLCSLCSLALAAAPARAGTASGPSAALLAKAQLVCNAVSATAPFDYNGSVSDRFKAALSEQQVAAVFASLYQEVGACLSLTPQTVVNPSNATFTFATQSGLTLKVKIALDNTQRIDTLLFPETPGDPTVAVASFADLAAALAALPGNAGFAFVPFDTNAPLGSHEQDVFAIGSSFKLWVFGDLVKEVLAGKRNWATPLAIQDAWRSGGSGDMYQLPTGYTLPTYAFAQKMISISDNTATDHLLHYLGRADVEEMQAVMGTAEHPGNRPLLATNEMFKLKWAVAPEAAAAYIQDSPAARQTVLDALVSVPLTDVCKDQSRCTAPTYVQSIEWYATPAELCAAMRWLYTNGDNNTQQILAVNTPTVTTGPGSHWRYAGYKGGGDLGIMTMVYVLESQNGKAACLATAWNNTAQMIYEARLTDITGKAIAYLEQVVP